MALFPQLKRYQIKEVLDWISKFDCNEKHQQTQSTRAANTGNWFLNNPTFQKWLRGHSSGNVLYCPGLAGAGKTYITSLVIDEVKNLATRKEGDIAVAFIYFDYQKKEDQTANVVTGSILRQWAQYQPELDSSIKSLYAVHQQYQNTPRSLSIDEYVRCMNSLADHFSLTFIMLDALDECESHERFELLNRVVRHMNVERTRIFATCRPHVHNVSDFFKNSEKVEIVAHMDDLRSYVTEELGTRELLEDSLKDEIVNKLCPQAKGL